MMYLVLIHSCITALTGGRLRRQKLKRTAGIGWILIAVFVLLCGWGEDVAGKKKARLLP